ncbi:MAG: DMT family transporter [Gammaproteobacteria bacterium]|nr:DMT family transporter [Gammaproteobacteria bacterium]
MGLGEVLSLACAVCWAIGVVLFKHSGESLSANNLNFFKNCIATLLIIPTALIMEGFTVPELSPQEWLIVILSGYFGIAIADNWYFQALRKIGAGRTAIVASLYSPFVILLSIFYLNESLALWQWLGFVLVITGILIVVYQKRYQEVDTHNLYRGILYAAASVFLTAMGVVMVKPVLDSGEHGFFWIVLLRLLAGVIGMFIFMLLRNKLKAVKLEFTTKKHNWFYLISASVFATYLAMLFWLGGFKYTDASVASVLNETANIFIVLLAWFFLQEPLNKRKLAGMALAFSGVVIFIGGI